MEEGCAAASAAASPTKRPRTRLGSMSGEARNVTRSDGVGAVHCGISAASVPRMLSEAARARAGQDAAQGVQHVEAEGAAASVAASGQHGVARRRFSQKGPPPHEAQEQARENVVLARKIGAMASDHSPKCVAHRRDSYLAFKN